ncbi:MAG: carbohydrate kinase family protein [Ignavibacteria bacterium]|nr:carbohydrate kinase family protein [Ignavibacteria bacterium]
MKIIVIGHTCKDIIHKDDQVTESFGGIIYSLLGFALVMKKEDNVLPFFNINLNDYEKYFDVLLGTPINDFSLIQKTDRHTNLVHLIFDGSDLKFECYQEKAEKIDLTAALSKIATDSNFYINMISGFEIELDDLREIKKHTTGKIYFDFHTMTRGMDENGKRFYRPIENWREWTRYCDVIQFNEIEMQNLTPEKLNEGNFVTEAIKTGTKIINITKGNAGAISYFIDNELIRSQFVSVDKNLIHKNSIGCGDIFGSVFAYKYFNNYNVKDSLEEAVRISSKKIEIENIEEIISLRK